MNAPADESEPMINVITHWQAVEMNTTPAPPPTAAATMVSFWQHNLVGIMAQMFASWLPLPNSVAYAVLS